MVLGRQTPGPRSTGSRARVIGAHTPEFSFESDLDNVRLALKAMAVEYPVSVDNRYAIWDAFANHYWPALYFNRCDRADPASLVR